VAALDGLQVLFNFETLLYVLLGSMMGLVFGILPGLGGVTAIAILMPLTYGMEPAQAVALLIAVVGSVGFGGAITSILLNTPGGPQNIATSFDGFPLTQQGKAGLAIGAAGMSSALGGIFGALVLTMLIPISRQIVLLFSYPDYCLMGILGIVVVIVASHGGVLKGLITAGLGLLISFVGYDTNGFSRFNFGNDYLADGISISAIVIGVFAIAEAIEHYLHGGTIAKQPPKVTGVMEGMLSVFKHKTLFFKSSILGSIIGVLPGVGGSVANFVSYMRAKESIKDNNRFGQGDIRGVIAPESSGNAESGGALVPTVAFGIPGNSEMAVLLGGLLLHGIEAGPQLMVKHVSLVYTMVFSLILANVLACLMGILMSSQLVKVTRVPSSVLSPIIIVVSLLGALALNGYFSDLVIAVVFGIVGYFMKKFGYSRVSLIIAIVLGKMAEGNFFQTYNALGLSAFYTRPVSLVILLLVVLTLVYPFIKNKRKVEV
jgi:putative tricarboxylic transport membrane protein